MKLTKAEAVRLGESTVISRRVHMISVDKPEEVRILAADAGSAFYGRQEKGTIYHIDIFHQVGSIDHRAVARAILNAVQNYPVASGLLDRMDIQTATGGGRITGNLSYGRGKSVRRAHANHVHLAVELAPEQLAVAVATVAAVEAEILKQGLEIRKVEKVVLDRKGNSEAELDLSAYRSQSDSLLKEKGSSPGANRTEKSQDVAPGERMIQNAARNTVPGTMEEACNLSIETLPPAELLQLLRSFPLESGDKLGQRWGEIDHILDLLENKNYIQRKRGLWTLTAEGERLQQVINLRLPELESMLRRFLRRLTAENEYSRSKTGTGAEVGRKRMRTKPEAKPINQGDQFNLTATAAKAACHWIQGQSRPGCIHYRAWCYSRPHRQRATNIILLVDSSASMSGKRLRAARLLAQHLVLSIRGKVAVIAFQGESVLVPAGFSRSLAKIQRQLSALKAVGLTPLAYALKETASFVRKFRACRPLVVLITDGIPTVPLAGGDPASDALNVAGDFQALPAELVCIGLDPNQLFLEKLSQKSGGRLYIVGELDTPVLAELVHKELQRRRAN